MSRHTPHGGFDSAAQAAWFGGQHKEPAQRRGRPSQKAAPVQVPPLPPVGRPEWGVPMYGYQLAIGDVLAHLHRDWETYRIDRFAPYQGGLPLGEGARIAFSGSWGIAVDAWQIVRILPPEGSDAR